MINNWHDKTVNVVDNSNNKVNTNFANINLIKFGLYTKILLPNNVRITFYK